MKSNLAPASHPPIKTAFQLLTSLEESAADAFRTGETELAFCLAAIAGAYSRGIVGDIANLLESVIGSQARAGILRRIEDEVSRSNAPKN